MCIYIYIYIYVLYSCVVIYIYIYIYIYICYSEVAFEIPGDPLDKCCKKLKAEVAFSHSNHGMALARLPVPSERDRVRAKEQV